MRVAEESKTREEVIRFYAKYDRHKKGGQDLPSDIDNWPWDNPEVLDRKLRENGLKDGVLAAYRTWQFVELTITDLLERAIVNSIFPGEPQAIGRLLLRGKLAEWFPIGAPHWWQLIGNGSSLDRESALIARPSVSSEAPAKWYIEDGSGRVLALLQRILRYGEIERTAWAYLGKEPDDRSTFIKSRPELKGATRFPNSAFLSPAQDHRV
jgi:hypothetical protein